MTIVIVIVFVLRHPTQNPKNSTSLRSSEVEHTPCKRKVKSSILFGGT
jgi:hypothetical protein